MRKFADLPCQLVLVFLAVICSYSTGRALGEDYGPAHVRPLTGPVAEWFLNLDGRVLVAGDDQGTVFAFVLGSDIKDVMDHLDALRVSEVEGCPPEGITCCDEAAHIWVIDAEFQKERFWLRLGGPCKLVPVYEGWADGPGVPFEPVDAAIWQQLTELGVTEPLMTLATEDGKMRVLVDPSWQNSALSLPRHPGVRTPSPLILVNHVNPNTQPPGPARPPGGCATRTPCKLDENGRACYADTHLAGSRHSERHHWYIHNPATNRWCEQVNKCNC
jgi:hypothetical protein